MTCCKDAGRAAVPGAGDADRHRRRRASRPTRPTSCAAPWPPSATSAPSTSSARSSSPAWCGDGYAARVRRALLQPDRGLRRVRLSREPRGELRAARLRLVLDQVPLPGGVLRRHPQQPADGLLPAGAARARRARARRRGAPARHQLQRLGLHAGAGLEGRAPFAVRLGFRQIQGLQRGGAARASSLRAATAMPASTAGARLPASRASPSSAWRRPMHSARWGWTGARRCGPRGGSMPSACARGKGQGGRRRARASAAAAGAASGRRAVPRDAVDAAGHAARRACGGGLHRHRPVAEGASGELLPRAAGRASAPCPTPSIAARACRRTRASRWPASC